MTNNDEKIKNVTELLATWRSDYQNMFPEIEKAETLIRRARVLHQCYVLTMQTIQLEDALK